MGAVHVARSSSTHAEKLIHVPVFLHAILSEKLSQLLDMLYLTIWHYWIWHNYFFNIFFFTLDTYRLQKYCSLCYINYCYIVNSQIQNSFSIRYNNESRSSSSNVTKVFSF